MGSKRLRLMICAVALVALVLGVMSGAGAVTLPIIGSTDNGLNDLAAIGQGAGQTPATVPTQSNPEPPLVATPRAVCGQGSHPEPGIQGRVPAG